jgi:hypothetical protein
VGRLALCRPPNKPSARCFIAGAIMALSTCAGWSMLAAPAQAAAKNIALQLAPKKIVANGTSTSTATATVTDAQNNGVPGEAVTFRAPGDAVSGTADHGDGTYTATITSTKAGKSEITASDGALTSAPQTLTRISAPATTANTTTSLVVVASHPVANQNVTLIATVTSSQSNVAPSGAITFENGGQAISGCGSDSVAPSTQSVTVFCQTSFPASTADLTAVFTPSPTASVTGSTSGPPASLTIGKDSTSTFLTVPNPVTVGARTTYTATVVAGDAGPLVPSGSVEFLDAGQSISGCSSQPLLKGAASSIATCTVSYSKIGSHSVTARYGGGTNFNGSGSSAQAVQFRTHSVVILGTITATMQWTFMHTPAYTKVLALIINGARVGATVTVTCHGRGCPLGKARTLITKSKAKPCKRKGKHRCPKPPPPGTRNLMPRFRNHRLHPGAQITVEITQPRWIGKYYTFTVRARRAPSISIGCVAAGGTRPGVGC